MAARWFLVPLAAWFVSCGSDAPGAAVDAEAAGRARAAAASARAELEATGAPAGTLAGLTLFEGVPAARTPINTSAEGGCGMDPSEPPLTETLVVAGARVANVFVWLENPPASEVSAASGRREVTQRGCVYRPHAIGVRTGETLYVSNADQARHNVHALPAREQNPGFNESQAAGAPPLELVFHAPEVAIPIVCDLHPWMKTWVGVFDHPYFAVTGADGRFEWSGLPPGEYRLRAWHESLGRLSATVHVPPDGGAVHCFTFQKKS